MRFHLLLTLGYLLVLATTAYGRPLTIFYDLAFPHPPVPDFGEVGGVLLPTRGANGDVKVVFGQDGRVTDCVGYFGSPDLSMYVEHFIRDSWKSPELAGETVYAWIVIGMMEPVHVSRLPGPPYPAFAEPYASGKVGLAVVFDHEGKVKSCTVKSCTFAPKFGEYVRQFVIANWKNPLFADRAFVCPFTYELVR